jgi:hypothetical protein
MDFNLGQWEVIKYYYYHNNNYHYFHHHNNYDNMNILRYTIIFPTDEGECSAAGSGPIIHSESPDTHRLECSMELRASLDTLEGRKSP